MTLSSVLTVVPVQEFTPLQQLKMPTVLLCYVLLCSPVVCMEQVAQLGPHHLII